MKRLAFLVDAENANPATLHQAFEAASAHGEPCIRRAYASFDAATSRSWRASPYAALGITPVHVPAVTKGKNAADIALAIDAMEIALTSRAEAVCIVSSDGDYALLGHRLRERGVLVIGAGDSRSAAGWKGACDVFAELPGGGAAARPVHSLDDLLASVRELSGNGGISLSDLGTALRERDSGFSPKRFGRAKLSSLLAGLPGVTVSADGGGHLVRAFPVLRAVPDTSEVAVA